MPKVKVHINGLVASGRGWIVDSISANPPMTIKSGEVDVDDGTQLTLASTEFYMGVPTKQCRVIVKVTNSTSIMKLETRNGSYVEGSFEVVNTIPHTNLMTVNKVSIDKNVTPKKFKRRILK